MITIKYLQPIIIRISPESLEAELPDNSYIIDHDDDNNYVSCKYSDKIFDIADFKYLHEAVEYCKLKIDTAFTL